MVEVSNWFRMGYKFVTDTLDCNVKKVFFSRFFQIKDTSRHLSSFLPSDLFLFSSKEIPDCKWQLRLVECNKSGQLKISLCHCNSAGKSGVNFVEPALVKLSILDRNDGKVFQRMVPSSNLSCFVEFYLSKEELIQSECQQADGSFSFCCEIFTHVKQLEPVSSADPRADPSGLSNDFGGGLLVTQIEEFFYYMKCNDVNNVNIGGSAHQIKNILAARSKVFFEENLTRQAEIEDIEPEVIELLYLFIQTVEINIPAMGRMAIYLLIAADKYQMNELENESDNYLLLIHMSPNNCLVLRLHGHLQKPMDPMKEVAKLFRRSPKKK